MATTDTFSSNSNYYLEIGASLQSQNRDANYSTISYFVRVHKKGSWSGHWSTTNMGNTGWADSSEGGYRDLWNNTNLAYDFTRSQYITFRSGTFRVYHNADGTGDYSVSAGMSLINLGSANVSTGRRSLPRLADVPPAPRFTGIEDVTQTSLEYKFRNNGDGGSDILQWQIGYGTSSSGPQNYVNSDGSTVITGLKPYTTYYFWARGRNIVGWGPWSVRAEKRTVAGAQVKLNGVWRAAVPYVKVNGVWKLAQPYVKVAGKWKPTI